MLRLRILTAVIGLPMVVWLLYAGPLPLKICFLTVCAVISITEMTAILFPTVVHDQRNLDGLNELVAERFSRFYGLTLAASAGIVMWIGVGTHPVGRLTVGGIVLLVLIAIVPAALSGRGVRYSFMLAACGLFATSYAFLPWLLIADMAHSAHAYPVLFLMTVVWAGDTGGYFGGRFFGKRPLAPSISPKKTVEGSVCGLIASMVGGVVFGIFFDTSIGNIAQIMTISLIAGGLGQVGDLIESLSKRYGAVKDSGKLFPGHGGLLDRVDALLMAAPVVWIYFNI